MQKLISAIIAGGWVSLVVIIVICLIALIVWSVFGIFASANANNGEYTMHNMELYGLRTKTNGLMAQKNRNRV